MRSKRKMETVRSGYSNREIINNTISWINTSEGINYWSGLCFSTKK